PSASGRRWGRTGAGRWPPRSRGATRGRSSPLHAVARGRVGLGPPDRSRQLPLMRPLVAERFRSPAGGASGGDDSGEADMPAGAGAAIGSVVPLTGTGIRSFAPRLFLLSITDAPRHIVPMSR